MTKEELKQRLIELADEWDNQDEIDHLFDYFIANGVTIRERGEWIPVTERLPEADKQVLVFTAHANVKVGRCNIYKNGTEVIWGTNDGLGERAITHWMPLPEPPERSDAE